MKMEKSALVKLLGDSTRINVIDFFLDNYTFDHSAMGVADAEDISVYSVYRSVYKLEKLGIIEQNRKVGKSKMYILDRDNPIVEKLIELEDILLETLEADLPSDEE